jgi:DNA ligase (NAD+)
MSENIKKKIEALRKRIRHHDYLYYVLSQPEISDKEYDVLMRQLKELEDKYPKYKSDYSPTVRVGGVVLEGFKTVRHKQKMLSLDNAYSAQELRNWDERVRKGLGKDEEIEYVVELKIDGVSANLTYEKGRLIIGATRGDGETGEDVTQNIKTIRSIPLVLLGKDIPDLIEIRGEVYMDRRDLEAINKEKEKSGEPLFANPRNAASGSLKLLDTAIVAKRRLKFFAHSLGEHTGIDFDTHWQFFGKLKQWGVPVNGESKLFGELQDVVSYYNGWQEKRDRLTYEIDGMVIKVNSLSQQKRLGFTLKSPRWAAAYKFTARQATTEVLDIKINVGRTGVITPTAELKAVECAGVIIRHATLHNFDEIKRLGIKIGDRVLIERAGDVIPKVVKVVKAKGRKEYPIPKTCPVCSGKVVKEKEEDVAYYCINPSCPAQLERGLFHFASRIAMDIEGMGESVVAKLVNLKLVRNFADIYRLTEKDLSGLELFKEKKIKNLLNSIENSKNRSLSRLIFALGIRHIGEKAAYVLAKNFRTMGSLMKAKLEDFDKIYEVGPVMAQSVVDYSSQNNTKKLIEDLKKAGVNFTEETLEEKHTALTGKAVVFTGELKGFSRKQAEDLARAVGASPSSSVSENTDFVIAGENPGSKFDKAKKIGIKIIDEAKFREMIK